MTTAKRAPARTAPPAAAQGSATGALLPWQRDDWQRLQALRPRWPHALLLHGQAGTGKTAFARCLAQGLLCEAPASDGLPCGRCAACGWFEQGNHPDFRVVCPESLQSAPADAEGAAAAKDEGKKTRAPSREIKVEQIRSLLDFCALGSHRQGLRVVLLYPADALNAVAANALLKTLEEPNPGVSFLLVSDRLDRLLPTIVSRCRQWPMRPPDAAAATAWLAGRKLDQPAERLAEAGGAPLAALALATSEYLEPQRAALAQLGAGAACDPFACGEALQKVPVPVVLSWLQRWLYDLLAQRTAHRPRYFPGAAPALARCADALDATQLNRLIHSVNRQRATENHPLNGRLVVETLFLQYRDIFQNGPR